ncbi:MAG: methyltransferase domain-containing protein [Candidatus Hinthialibacter antarcticus]|nr:methyltransferase domain-containing protein [Candidatus Hinthialibacter antarcticus]
MTNQNIQSILEQAQQYADEGNLQLVEQTLNDGLAHNPASAELMGHLGYFYYQQKRWRRAEVLLKAMTKTGDADENAQQLLHEIQKHILSCPRVNFTTHTSAHNTYYALAFPFLILSLKLCELFTKQSYFSLSRFINTLKPAPAKTQQACLAYHKAREILIASNAMPFQQRGARILDLGAGNNSLPVYWSRFGAEVIALDGSMYGFPSLRGIQHRDGGSAQFICGDVTRLPFCDSSFNGVSALCMIEHLPYDADKTAMREIYRILKPGGVAAITVEGNREHFEEWIELPYEIGFQIGNEHQQIEELFCRNYSEKTLNERLIQSAEWETLSSGFYDDCCIPFRNYFNRLQPSISRAVMRPFQPLLSLMFYRLAQKTDTLSPSSIGFAVLRKPL